MADTEPSTAAPGDSKSITKGTIKVPGGGRIKKTYALAGVAVVGVAVVIYYRNRNAAAVTPVEGAPTVPDATATGSGNADPTSGGAGVIGYDSNGNPIYGVGTGQQVDTGPPFSTNAAWSQYAITILVGNGMDAGPLTDALGAYIGGSPVVAAQQTLINDAIAVAGYPPVAGSGGKPPGINLSAPSTGGTNPTGSGTGGSKSWKFPAPGGLKASSISHTGYRLSWNPVKGPGGQTPASYTVRTYDSAGHEVDTFDAHSASTAEYGRGGGGLKPGTYHTNVWANGGSLAPPHATVTVHIK